LKDALFPGVARMDISGHRVWVIRLIVIVALALLHSGCGSKTSPAGGSSGAAAGPSSNVTPASSATSGEPIFYQNRAQTGLPRVKLWLGSKETSAELCYTVTQIATGLMHRQSIGENETMFFVFGGPGERSFYMRNVPFDIDVAYIDTEGVIREIVRLKAKDEQGVPSKSDQIQYVLEAAPDYFTKNGLGPGTLIATDKGSLKQVLAPLAQLR
jgi:uncharacterized membrane protein (UPF0127 family)